MMKPVHSKPVNAFAQSPIQAPKDRGMFGGPLLNGLSPKANPQTTRIDMTRNDGTQKGRGYLGTILDSEGRPMTEFSIGVGMDGRDIEIPTLVPTLDPGEIDYLRNMQPGTPMPQSIQQKAIEHAKMRMRQGLSPFHDSGPSHTKPKGY